MAEAKAVPEQEPIPAGAIFTVTSGEYSDFGVDGVFRARKEIPAERLRDEYLEGNPERRGHHSFDERGFLAFLVRGGYIDQVESWELYLGGYDRSRFRVHRFEAWNRIVEDVDV